MTIYIKKTLPCRTDERTLSGVVRLLSSWRVVLQSSWSKAVSGTGHWRYIFQTQNNSGRVLYWWFCSQVAAALVAILDKGLTNHLVEYVSSVLSFQLSCFRLEISSFWRTFWEKYVDFSHIIKETWENPCLLTSPLHPSSRLTKIYCSKICFSIFL